MVCLTIFFVGRRLPLDVILPIIFVPGFIFAAVGLYYYNETHPAKRWPIFGNSNHHGAFLLLPLFIGLYLTLNTSWWFAPFTVVIALGLALSSCRGAQIAAITGLMYVACLQTPWLMALIPAGMIGAWLMVRKERDHRHSSKQHRFSLIIAALMMIRKKPLAGYGLRTFRREYPAIVPELISHRLTKYFYARGTTIESQNSHRVHNDHLEIIVELGLIGYLLFISIFTSFSWFSPILAGAIVAIAVDGLFFFPLREAHTAFPFWLLAGAMASTGAATMAISPYFALIFILIVGRLIYGVAVKTIGLFYYDCSVKTPITPNPEDEAGKRKLTEKQRYLDAAIRNDPYNNIYLTEGYYYNVFQHKEAAYQYASRCMENYDGGKVKWGIADQYARALINLGGFGVAKMALKYALHICPDFKQSRELMKQIEGMEQRATT
jgi:hypothetical protein